MSTPSVTALSFSPTATSLAFLLSTSSLHIHTGATLLPALQLPPSTHLIFGTPLLAVSSSTAPLVRFIHPDAPRLLPHVATARTPAPATVIALSPPRLEPGSPLPHGRFAVSTDGALRIEAYDGAHVAALSTHGATLFAAAFSADGTLLAVGDTKGIVRVWRLTDHAPTSVVAKAHAGFVSALSFSPSGDTLASAGWDGSASVWRVSPAALRRRACVRAEPVRSKAKAHAVALAADSLLATGGAGGVVRVWRVGAGAAGEKEPVAVDDAHGKPVYKLAFAPDGRHVASGGADGSVRVLGVPGKPMLVSKRPRVGPDGEGVSEGAYEIRPVEVVLKGQRADRKLIFCPSSVVTLACPICTHAYDPERRKPIVSGVCGHTFACSLCNEKLWDTDGEPTCPVCRAPLVDVVPNYELLRVLAAAQQGALADAVVEGETTRAGIGPSARDEFGEDCIDLKRLAWLELPELAYMRRHSCAVYNGTMDGEAVAMRLPAPGADREQIDVSGVRMSETERHLSCLKRLRGPHIVQLYGVSRTTAPDNRTVVVSELPSGGTLADNLSLLRSRKRSLPAETVLSLSLQIIRAVRFLHESQTSAGWALSPDAIALTMPMTADWSMRHRIKLMELGGTVCKAECTTDMQRVFPADYIGYMAPEMLDEDRSALSNREAVFGRLCLADMYSLGVLLWEIAAGNKPFEGKRPAQVVAAVVGRGERPGFPPSGIASTLQNLISRLWAKDPADRPSAREACELLEMVPSAPPLL